MSDKVTTVYTRLQGSKILAKKKITVAEEVHQNFFEVSRDNLQQVMKAHTSCTLSFT
jgi:hypothetical protein